MVLFIRTIKFAFEIYWLLVDVHNVPSLSFFNSTTIVFGKNNPTDTPGYSSDLAVRISSSGLHARLGSFLSVVLKEIVYDSI